jgi:hypothetical protein
MAKNRLSKILSASRRSFREDKVFFVAQTLLSIEPRSSQKFTPVLAPTFEPFFGPRWFAFVKKTFRVKKNHSPVSALNRLN